MIIIDIYSFNTINKEGNTFNMFVRHQGYTHCVMLSITERKHCLYIKENSTPFNSNFKRYSIFSLGLIPT